jgi:hypothetical protein
MTTKTIAAPAITVIIMTSTNISSTTTITTPEFAITVNGRRAKGAALEATVAG